MEQYQTETGRRQDLEMSLMEINPYLGAIGPELFPINDTAQKSGTYYYQQLQSDSTTDTHPSESGQGKYTDRVELAEHSNSWNVSSRFKGYTCRRDRVPTQFGNIERADQFGSKAALRSVMRDFESGVAANILDNSSANQRDILDKPVRKMQAALKDIRRFNGEKVLVTSQEVFNRMMDYSSILDRFNVQSTRKAGVQADQILAREPEALKMLLQSIIGLDRVLIGDDDIWYDGKTVYEERAAIVALPREDEFSELEEAILGKTFRYQPEDQSYPFFIESSYDPDNKYNKWDCEIWDDIQVMNPDAIEILTGFDEDNSTATTTTTTTTA